MSEKKESYFGWVVVAASCLMMAAVYAPNTSVAGLFMLPMATDFGINITESTLQITIGILAGAISASFVGKLMGKFGVTRVMSIALAFYGLSLLGAAYLSNSIYVVYIFTAMKGLAFPATTMIPVSIMINTWFGPKLTGRAMGISMAGFGIGGMILNPITSYIIENWGWRHGYGLFGVLALLMIPYESKVLGIKR